MAFNHDAHQLYRLPQLGRQITRKWRICKYKKSDTSCHPEFVVPIPVGSTPASKVDGVHTVISSKARTKRDLEDEPSSPDLQAPKRVKILSFTPEEVAVRKWEIENTALKNMTTKSPGPSFTIVCQSDTQFPDVSTASQSSPQSQAANMDPSTPRSQHAESGYSSKSHDTSAKFFLDHHFECFKLRLNDEDGSTWTFANDADQQTVSQAWSPFNPDKEESNLSKLNYEMENEFYEPWLMNGIDGQAITTDPRSIFIDLADSTTRYSLLQIKKIEQAANFLFCCRLHVEAFPLYLLVWKQHGYHADQERIRSRTFISCIRTATTEAHHAILRNILTVESKQPSFSLHPAAKGATAYLHSLFLARICLKQGDGEAFLDYINQAIVHRNELTNDELLHSLAGLWSGPTGILIASCVLGEISSACEVYFASHQDLHPLNSFPEPELLILSTQTMLRGLALSPETVHDPDTGSIEVLLIWCLPRIKGLARSYNFFKNLSSPMVVFWHFWWQWINRPFLENQTLKFEWLDGKAPESLAVLSSLLTHFPQCPTPHSQFLDKQDLLATVSGNLKKLTRLDEEAIHGHFRRRHIWLLRQSPPEIFNERLLRQLRGFIQRNLDVTVPEIRQSVIPLPPASTQSNSSRSPVESQIYGNPAFAQSLQPSTSSSFRLFANCAKSVRSLRSHMSISTPYSVILRQYSMTGRLDRSVRSATDALSVSLRSLSLHDSSEVPKGKAGSYNGKHEFGLINNEKKDVASAPVFDDNSRYVQL